MREKCNESDVGDNGSEGCNCWSEKSMLRGEDMCSM